MQLRDIGQGASCPKCGLPLAAAPSTRAPATNTSPDIGEKSYYSDEMGVRVTSARAIIRNKTYAMSNISSVSTWRIPAKRVWPIVLGILGLLIGVPLLFAGSDTLVCGGIFAFGGVAGVIVGIVLKDRYAIRISAASGETNALISPNKGYVDSVVAAMNEAIVGRG